MKKALLFCMFLGFSVSLFAGELYDELSPLNDKKMLKKLMQRESFSGDDVADLDLLWSERTITECQVKMAFLKFQIKHTPEVPEGPQEVFLWHLENNISDVQDASDEDRLFIEKTLRAKSVIFDGAVQINTISVDSQGIGVCRWNSPNPFLVLYVVKAAFDLPSFPADGATLVADRL